MTFGEKLKELRISHDFTQTDLANKLNLSKANISKYESNHVEPNMNTIREIALLFDVSIDYLLGGNLSENIEIDEDIKKITDTILELNEEDREVIWHMLDALKKKHK